MGGWMSTRPASVDGSTVDQKYSHWNPNNPKTMEENVVLIPVDESRQAEEAFDWYLRHMHKKDNVTRIIHCIDITFTSSYLPDLKAQPFDEELRQKKRICTDVVDKYNKKLLENDLKGSVQTYFGDPGQTIIEYAITTNSTHIVMGSRGFGLLRQTILGSVSDFVINHTKIPVTVVPHSRNKYF